MTMTMLRRIIGPVAALLLAAALLAGCGSPSQVGPAAVAVEPGATIIDVRTPAEYAAEHLAGSVNIDLQSPDFAGQVGKLDRAGIYVVYCRSGNRSAEAARVMTSMGYASVRDAGSLQQAESLTGLAITAR